MKNIIKNCLFILLAGLFIGCTEQKNENTLIVGVAADNPPYEYIASGSVVGLDIEIIKKIAEHLGKNIVIKNMEFSGLIAALSNNKVDLVISGLSVTPERALQVDFSDIYASAGISVVYRAVDNFKHVDDLRRKIIGAQLGTTWEKYAQSLSVNAENKIVSLLNNVTLIQELTSARVDAVVLETNQAKKFVHDDESLAYFAPVGEAVNTDFAIAMPKNSPLRESINEAISTMKKDGTIDYLMVKWIKQ